MELYLYVYNYFTVLFEDLQSIISAIVSITNGSNMNDNLKGHIFPHMFDHWLVVLEECLVKLNVQQSIINHVIRNNHHLFIEN